MINIIKSLLVKIPAIIIMAISWHLSSGIITNETITAISDKIIHIIAFTGLSVAWTWWFSYKQWIRKPFLYGIIVILIVSAYGAIDEIHQSFVPGRDASISDWLVDTIGGILGALIGYGNSHILAKIKK